MPECVVRTLVQSHRLLPPWATELRPMSASTSGWAFGPSARRPVGWSEHRWAVIGTAVNSNPAHQSTGRRKWRNDENEVQYAFI